MYENADNTRNSGFIVHNRTLFYERVIIAISHDNEICNHPI
jgi:hypothetical protein